MSKAAGFLLIVAGVGAAAYVVPHMDASDSRAEQQLSDVTTIATNGATAVPSSVVPGSMFGATGQRSPQNSAVDGSSANPARTSEPRSDNRPALRVADSAASKIATGSAPAKSVDDAARSQLTRDIQRELKRVGCLTSDASGEWNDATRQAMKAFIDRVNATLPIDQPDHILKTLVQGHPGNACNRSCPAGQALATDGRCAAPSVVTQARKRIVPRPNSEAGSVASPVAPVVPAPVVAARPEATPARNKLASSWEPTVTPAAPSSSPAAKIVAPPTPVAPSPVAEVRPPRAEDLPGRMAVGASATGGSVPSPVAALSRSEVVSEPKPKPSIVIKPTAKPADVPARNEAKPERTEQAEQPADRPRPKVAAVGASEEADEPKPERKRAAPTPAAKPERVVERRPSPPVVAYRPPPPPPRYVGVYVSPRPVYSERSSFGPRMFERMAREAR